MAENFGVRMARHRAAKRAERAAAERDRIAAEHNRDDGSLFDDGSESFNPDPIPAATPRPRTGLVFCPAGLHYVASDEMRGALCYWHKRHPEARKRVGW